MSVLHITRDLPPRTRGGISTAVGLIVDQARSQGETVSVVSFDGWRPSAKEGVVTVEGPVCRISGPAGLERALAFAVEQSPRRIVVHHGMLWDFASDVRAHTAAETCLFVHVAQRALRRQRGFTQPTRSELAQEVALGEADALFVPGEAARTLLAEDFPREAARAQVVPMPRPPRLRSNASREPGRVLLVGRFDTLKGTADALAALELLLALRPEARLVLAGGLPDNRKSERRWLRKWRLSVPEPVAERMEFVGWLSTAELADQYARATVALAPSHMETYGLALLEAQQHGCAVVVTDIAPHRERVDAAKPHAFVPPGDPRALADATAEFL
ncbi:MAG: glycosyltransferase family 4 protein [Deltaproteobacteria bacterium]|nr:glycosyltransferase family 4 protein [Deltaproteobacteria bacterium]